jgi:TRAP-type C4-dicarboxylate transport system substrate-binding protein
VDAEAPAFSEELKKNNVVPIFLATGYPVAFFSTKPLNNLNGLKGEKWRSASFWHQDFLKNAGATPVSMHWGPEIYDALKARTLDGLMVNVDSGYMLKVHEAAPYVLVSKDLWLGHLYVLAMNNDIWNGLAPEDRAAIQRAAETSYRTLGSVMDQNFDAQVDELRKGGANVRILDPNELERWGAATKYKDVQDAWVREQQRKGATNVGPVFEKVNSIMNDVMG